MNTTELSSLTVPQLRALAREAAISGRSRMRKAELIAALAEVAQAKADRASVARHTPLTPTPIGAAMDAKDRYLAVVGRLGAENGGPAVSAAWEDYLDACFAAETCTRTDCWDRATDGDGRCGRHSWGPALGDDRVPSSEVADDDPAEVPEAGAPTSSGYHDCACAGCFDVQVGHPGEVCSLCEEAGCSDDADQECYRGDAYEG